MEEKQNQGKPQMTYATALEALKEIVQNIENNKIEIEDLANQINRANKLIAYCNETLKKVQSEVDQIKNLTEQMDNDVNIAQGNNTGNELGYINQSAVNNTSHMGNVQKDNSENNDLPF